MNFVVRGKKFLLPGAKNPEPAALHIQNGRIAAIGPMNASFEGTKEEINFDDQVVMSALVDTHAHINEPGRTEWEGFDSATKAAAAGGIGTVIDMPLNSIPATTTLAALQLKRKSAANHCYIDYGFWGGVVPGNMHELAPMSEAGVWGFKSFLCPSGVPEFEHVSRHDLELAMPLLAKLGRPLIVHAELESEIPASHTTELSARAYQSFLDSRPPEWEVRALELLVELSEKTKCRTHIVHLSAADALSTLSASKKRGVAISAETCPHYLSLHSEDIADGATHFKCAPPIRDSHNCDRLWKALADGLIDFIVSDHSPCTPALKLFESGNFQKAWGGIASLQFSLPVVWTEMSRRGFSLGDLSRLMSFNTAKFLGLDDRKGQLKVGCDADLTVWGPSEEYELKPSDILHKHKITPYLGRQLKGRVHQTYLRGKLVYDKGEFPNGPLGHEAVNRKKF